MTSENKSILENLTDAIALSRSVGRKIYVFKEGAVWGYSGKLPTTATRFYVAYPNCHLEQSNCPELFTSELPAEVQKAPELTIKTELKGSKLMNGFKKYFVGYCAFAPHVALILSLWLFHGANMKIENFWSLSFFICMFCLPLSAIFALIALHRPKDGRIAAMASMLASDAHIIFYGGLWVSAAVMPDSMLMVGATMVSLIMSGLALLLLLDNEEVPKELSE